MDARRPQPATARRRVGGRWRCRLEFLRPPPLPLGGEGRLWKLQAADVKNTSAMRGRRFLFFLQTFRASCRGTPWGALGRASPAPTRHDWLRPCRAAPRSLYRPRRRHWRRWASLSRHPRRQLALPHSKAGFARNWQERRSPQFTIHYSTFHAPHLASLLRTSSARGSSIST